jgi:hypothetical protein
MSGRIELASRLKQSEQQIRTSLKRLEELDIITITATSRFSVYTIENYNKYQDNEEVNNQPNNQQITNKQPTDNQQTTTKQELNNLNIKETKQKSGLALLVSMGVPENLAKDWLLVRKAKRAPATQTAFDAIKKHAEENGYTFVQAVQICTEKNWVGFNTEWLKNNSSKPNGQSKGVSVANDDATLMSMACDYKVATKGKTKQQLVSSINAAMGIS